MGVVPDGEQAAVPRYDSQGNGHVPARIAAALVQLAEAQRYAGRHNVWDFAVEVGSLRLSTNDLRWLIYKGLVEHGWEVTPVGAKTRSFRPDMGITLSQRSCFVATATGLSLAGACSAAADKRPSRPTIVASRDGHVSKSSGPHWDAARRELRLDGVLVKRFRQPSANQERILSAFQEEGWPPSIEDPLPPDPDQAPEHRLNHAVSRLNGYQRHRLIRFEGNGGGDGVVWKRIPQTPSHRTRRPPK
ncbi:MAG: hypothetical protein NTW96_24770 [Planctomycetia bacterium]|nr:hypothetical protein [Planctomycetia bacterium]